MRHVVGALGLACWLAGMFMLQMACEKAANIDAWLQGEHKPYAIAAAFLLPASGLLWGSVPRIKEPNK